MYFYGVGWFKQQHFLFVFGRCPIRVSFGIPIILTEDSHTFPQSLQIILGSNLKLGKVCFLPHNS
jgi:hypothetical protein